MFTLRCGSREPIVTFWCLCRVYFYITLRLARADCDGLMLNLCSVHVQSTTTFESPLNVEATRCASCVDRRLRARLDSEREMCDALRLELAESKRGHQSQQQRDSKKLNDFSRYETARSSTTSAGTRQLEAQRLQQVRDSKKLNDFSRYETAVKKIAIKILLCFAVMATVHCC